MYFAAIYGDFINIRGIISYYLLLLPQKRLIMGLIEFWVQTKGTERTTERLEIMISHTKLAMDKVDDDTASVLDDVVDFMEEIRKEVLAGEH